MSNDHFFDRLRRDAAGLRFEPDGLMSSRLAARIRDRIADQPATVAQMLARWFRPITASFVMLALVAALSVGWLERRDTTAPGAESLVSNSVEITVDGDTYTLAE